MTVTLDKTAPSNSISVGTPQYQADNNLYIGGGTPISITAMDSGSGIGEIGYAVDEGVYTAYSGAFTLGSYSDGVGAG